MIRAALDDCIDRVRAIQKDLTGIVARDDGSHRQELIRHRRALANEFVTLSATAGDDERLKNNPALAADFRRLFSAMRTAMALHQSKWPAIDVDPANPDYIASAQTVRKANKDFADWFDALLKR